MRFLRRHSLDPILQAAISSLVAALLFWAFFQFTKLEQIQSISPFAQDPPDAVGSIAFQVAVAASLLSLARAARAGRLAPGRLRDIKSRLALHGSALALGMIALTVFTDFAATALRPVARYTAWVIALYGGLGLVSAVSLLSAFALLRAGSRLAGKAGSVSNKSETLRDAIEDCLQLAFALLQAAASFIPGLRLFIEPTHHSIVSSLDRLDRSWISPRWHPWRFCLAAGVVIGLSSSVLKALVEGIPAHLGTGLILLLIFIFVETATICLLVLVLGNYLGIRASSHG